VGLTLNIIAHELKPFGRVVRTLPDNPVFHSARLFLEGRAFAPGILYVCQTPEQVRAVNEASCHAVFANCGVNDVVAAGDGASSEAAPEAAPEVAAKAALTVVGGASALVVFDALLETFSRFSEWTAAMDRVCQTGGTIQRLIDVSEPFLRNNVVVLDPALKLLGYTKGVRCDDPITMELIEHGYHTEDNIRKFKLHKRFKPWAEAKGFVVNESREICKYVTVVRSFTSKSAFSLIVVMMCNVADPEPYLLDAYEMFVDRIGFYALRDYPGDKPSGSVVDTFLKDLIGGHIEGEAAVAERCRYAGIPAESRFSVYYIGAGESGALSRRLLADVSRAVAPGKTLLVDDAVVVLSFDSTKQCERPWDEREEHDGGVSIDARLGKLLGRYELACGKSSSFSRLVQTPVAFEQARQAYDLGIRFQPAEVDDASTASSSLNTCEANLQLRAGEGGRVFRFDDFGAAYLASLLSEGEARLLALTRAGAVLSAIAASDSQSNTDNYEFLRAYLVYERRTSVVAEKLHMHRNNVNYRIGRIEEQFGLDVSDPVLRLHLLAAFQLRDALAQR